MYDYPSHLARDIDALPSSCGVYIFHGEVNTYPLYIGKSVNIRRRVKEHLRNPSEARLKSAIRRITYIETVGEIGALLLESALVKEKQPLYNKRLRKARRLCTIKVLDTGTCITFSDEMDFSHTPDLYGLFVNRAAAVKLLLDIAAREQLCLTLLNIDKSRQGQPCFRYRLNKCAGACCGAETVQQHQARLRAALIKKQVRHWPFPGRISLEEKQGQRRVYHVINNWFYLGSEKTLNKAKKLQNRAEGFDRDCYRILCQRIFNMKGLSIHLLDTTTEDK